MTYYPEPECHIRDKVKIIFLDSTKLKIVWKKITIFFKQGVSVILWSFSSFFKIFFKYKIHDIYISHNNCLGHMLIT